MIKVYHMHLPQIDRSCFVAESADVIGHVMIGVGSSVWFHAVIRGDSDRITIGKDSNIQDNATLHCSEGYPVIIGNHVSVGHNAVVHGATVKDNVLIGMGAIILNGAVIGENSIIGAGAVVTENTVIAPNSLVVGVPGKVVRELDEEEIREVHTNAKHYVLLAKDYTRV